MYALFPLTGIAGFFSIGPNWEMVVLVHVRVTCLVEIDRHSALFRVILIELLITYLQ